MSNCPVAGVPWKKPQNPHNWTGKNLLMDVPAGAMGERILYTGDEVTFYINEKKAVKIGNKLPVN